MQLRIRLQPLLYHDEWDMRHSRSNRTRSAIITVSDSPWLFKAFSLLRNPFLLESSSSFGICSSSVQDFQFLPSSSLVSGIPPSDSRHTHRLFVILNQLRSASQHLFSITLASFTSYSFGFSIQVFALHFFLLFGVFSGGLLQSGCLLKFFSPLIFGAHPDRPS